MNAHHSSHVAGPRVTLLPSSMLVLVALCASLLFCGLVSADDFDDVERRGVVICGVNYDLPGFARTNSLGAWSGLDVDFCRAIAAAMFADREAVEFVPVTSTDRFDALRAERFDVLVRNTTWTLDRQARVGEFAGVNYYDGQGFMVTKRSGIRSALELDGRKICVSRNTTTELNAIDFFEASNMRYRPVYFTDENEMANAYETGGCDALTTDRSGLAGRRAGLLTPDAHVVLPEIISKEPLGPVVRANESRWANVVRWTLNCMINAEEMGITSANARALSTAVTPAQRRLLGLEGDAGDALGLEATWCTDVIAEVGNYGESYERNVGENTELGLARGVNKLWTDGGLMYAPPIR